ncbi:MAG TPA: 2-dehydropantoate 2-reductase, partial [Helicobacteraceae bacterium]|nr:2-dehydropantoate 2-reductase [Helicobacteraceae bacterium]
KNTELETLSGYIVLEGEKFDIATPYMSKMYHALKNELYQK